MDIKNTYDHGPNNGMSRVHQLHELAVLRLAGTVYEVKRKFNVPGDYNFETVLQELGYEILQVELDENLVANSVYAVKENSHLKLSRRKLKSCNYTLCAADRELLVQIDTELRELFAKEDIAVPGKPKITYWYRDNYIHEGTMQIDAAGWEEAQINYPQTIAEDLDKVIDSFRNGSTGINIWHGDPGTGKTSMIRTMARELAGEVEFHLITDPRALMQGDTGYLMEVIDSAEEDDGKGHLVILEDAGKLVQHDGDETTEEALGRILNITDGILGQNLRLSLLITTNANLHQIHPAVQRAGRCQSLIHFRTFEATEAREWLKEKGYAKHEDITGKQSLADLYGILTGREPITHDNIKTPLGFTM